MNLPLADKNPPVMLLAAFHEIFSDSSPEWILPIPGRDLWVAAAPAGDNRFTLAVPALTLQTVFSAQSAKQHRTLTNRPLPSWARYAAGVILQLCQRGGDSSGLNILLAGNEPSGPRFDYAIGMAVAALWHERSSSAYTPADLIAIVDQTRRDYIES